MPAKLVPRGRFFDEAVERARQSSPHQKIVIRSPWFGYMPDIDPYQSPASACEEIIGLVARSNTSGKGEVLTPDAGFAPVAIGTLPLGDHASTARSVTMLAQFNRTTTSGVQTGEEQKTFIAVAAGDGSTIGSNEPYRLKQNGTWQLIPWATNASTGVTDTDEPKAGRGALSDWAVMPFGAPNRSEYGTEITVPALVWCNETDRVMVYPVDPTKGTSYENGSFETLTSAFTATFKATTVEHWNGRLYFGNITEGSNRYRQRVRRTALFTADPKPTTPGAGAYDVRDFDGDLLRLEKLGNVLAAYFEDGVAFISKTGIATAPDSVELLRDRRGLLSTWAVTPISDQQHFGIYDDGWYILDPTGRFTEVGVTNIDGVVTRKWKDTFYGNLDTENRSRMTVSYDGVFVRIAYPKTGDTDNEEVWIYDPRGDRVFRDRYPVIQWGLIDQQIRAGVTFDQLVGTFENMTDGSGNVVTTWASLGSQTGLRVLSHGTLSGHVVTRDYKNATRYDTGLGTQVYPSFTYRSKLNTFGDPTVLKVANKLWAEYIQVGTGLVSMKVMGDSTEGEEGGSVAWDKGMNGDQNIARRDFNFTSANFQFEVSGQGPVEIRSFIVDVTPLGSEESFNQ